MSDQTPDPTRPIDEPPPVPAPPTQALPQADTTAVPQGWEAYAPPPAPTPGYAVPPAGPYPSPDAYGQAPYGYPAYGPPPVPYAAPAPQNTSALVLTIISAMLTLSCYFTLAGIPALILGIIALTRQSTDPLGSRRMSRYGWITLAVLAGLILLAIIGFIIFVVASSPSSTGSTY